MATKKVSKIQKTADTIIDQALQIHDTTLEVSDTLVEGSIATGERWQKLMAKALKDGTVLFGKQQDMALDTLEELKGQYLHGNARFRKLFGIKAPSFAKAIENAAKPAAAKIKDTTNMAKEVAKLGVKKAKKAVTGSKAKAKKAAKAVEVTASKELKTVASKRKVVAKKTTSKKAAAKKVTAKKNIVKDNLTKIEGIGPKIQKLLNDAGIRTFKTMATVDAKSLQTVLDNAGPRYKMHNPKTWRQQAKLAATGKWDKLNDLQEKLKGGVKVKK